MLALVSAQQVTTGSLAPLDRASAPDTRARLIAALQIATDTITVNTAISRRVIVRLDQTLEGKSHVSSFGHQT